MRHLRILGLCLVAAFALSVVAASAASAADPAIYECAPAAKETVTYKKGKKTITKSVNTGNRKDSACKKVVTKDKFRIKGEQPGHQAGPEGAFELGELATGYAFTGTGGGSNLEIVGIGGLTCTAFADAGTFNGPKSAGGINVTFTGCELLHHQCETGATLGEINTSPLKGEIGYINKATHEVGVLLSSETGIYEVPAMHCAELGLRTSGSVIGVVTSPVNVFTSTATLTFSQSAGFQSVKKFEGEAGEHTLEVETCGYPTGCAKGEYSLPGPAGESTLATGSISGKLELKA